MHSIQIGLNTDLIVLSHSNEEEKAIIPHKEQFILNFLKENGDVSIKELTEKMNCTSASIHRYVQMLISEGKVVRVGVQRSSYYKVVEK